MFQCKNGKNRGDICRIIIPRLRDEGFSFRILEIDDQKYQVATDSLQDALMNSDHEICGENVSIDNQFDYYVPDLCIYLSDEDLVSALRVILNGGDVKMRFKVEESFGIVTQIRFYDDLAELCVAEDINECRTRLVTIKNGLTIDSYKDEPIVKNTVSWLEDLFHFEIEPEIEVANPNKKILKVSVCLETK